MYIGVCIEVYSSGDVQCLSQTWLIVGQHVALGSQAKLNQPQFANTIKRDKKKSMTNCSQAVQGSSLAASEI